MNLSIAVPCRNQLPETKAVWGALVASTTNKETIQLVVIDDASDPDTREFIESAIFPYFPNHKYFRNDAPQGVIKVMQQAVQESSGDVVAIFHNDLFVLEHGWSERVMAEFESDAKLGLVGFHGGEVLAPNGGIWNVFNNFLERGKHGVFFNGVKEVIAFDGIALIGRRAMFNEVGGFDQNFVLHHFYDRDISLASHKAGWKNKLIGVYVHHLGGVTANRPEYQLWADRVMGKDRTKDLLTGDQDSYSKSEQHFFYKWASYIQGGRHYQQR